MKLRNTSNTTQDLPTLGLSVPAGHTIDVSGQAADALIRQGTFRKVQPPKRRTKPKTAPTTDTTTEAPASDQGD